MISLVHELLSYLNQLGVLTIMVLAQQGLLGQMETPIDLSGDYAIANARLRRDQGKPQQARELLAPVYGWFTEGFVRAIFNVNVNAVVTVKSLREAGQTLPKSCSLPGIKSGRIDGATRQQLHSFRLTTPQPDGGEKFLTGLQIVSECAQHPALCGFDVTLR
jgi:hypothetical protein